MHDTVITHRTRLRASDAAEAELGRYLALNDGGELVHLALRGELTRIGRDPSADISLDDASVSRRHARIIVRDDGVVEVLDDRSLNGTFVNGRRVDRQPLRDGDVIAVGRRLLRYVERPASAAEDTEESPAATMAAALVARS